MSAPALAYPNRHPAAVAALLLAAVLAVLAVLAFDGHFMPAAPASAMVNLQYRADDHRVELENRLRLADRVLRVIAADMARNASEPAPIGASERHYFDAITFQRAGQAPIQLLPASGSMPVQDAAMQAQLARGDTVLLSSPAQGNTPARIVLAREVTTAGAPPTLLAAAIAPQYLWETALSGTSNPGLCVRNAGGVTLYCSTTDAWQASAALAGDVSTSGQALAWTAGAQSWQGAAAMLRPASPRMSGHWTVLAIAAPGATTAPFALTRPDIVAGAGAVALAALAALLYRRPRRSASAGARAVPTAAAAGPDLPEHAEPGFDEPGLQRRLEMQRNAIRAMAEIDRASLSRAGIDRQVELASSHLLQCTGAEALTVVVFEPEGLNRMTVTHAFAHDDGPPAAEQKAIDASARKLLAVPTEGGWLHRLDDLPLLQPLARRGHTSAFVLPIHQDGQLAGLIILACRDPAHIGSDETSNARAITGRLGAALTSLAREQALYAQTHFDSTTSLPNRQYLKEHLPPQISRARRDRVRLALLFVNLDGFKKVNRVAGHSRGDLVLMESATRIRECLREEDLVTRFGGDEFVVVLPKVNEGLDARRVADKLLLALARPFPVDGEEHHLGCSIGISIFPDDAQTVDAMLRNADSAMFNAKSSGRGRYAFFDAAVNSAAIDRSSLELELHHAIAHGEFVVHYQPQIDLKSGQIDGAEALVRWIHPTRGLVSPYEFIAIAEQSGLIEQISEQVMLAACRQFRDWDAMGIAPDRISVNVSSLEVTRGDIVSRVERVLNDTGLRPMHLELELTEGVFLEEASGALDKLKQLRQRGVRIAIDDFGTGYSSLSYLRRLPIDVVKIDQSFIRDLTTNQDSCSIVRAVLEVAHSLGKLVVAEGVETEQHSTQLATMGCDVGQGYLWSRPLPAKQFASFCRQWQSAARPMAPASP